MIEFPMEQYDKLLVMDTRIFSRYDQWQNLDEWRNMQIYVQIYEIHGDLGRAKRFLTKSICVYLWNKFKLKFVILFFLCIDLFIIAYNFYISYFIWKIILGEKEREREREI